MLGNTNNPIFRKSCVKCTAFQIKAMNEFDIASITSRTSFSNYNWVLYTENIILALKPMKTLKPFYGKKAKNTDKAKIQCTAK